MDDRPILFFDSGVGGLSVRRAGTRRILPNAPFVYVADSAGFPYGVRNEAEIAARVPALLGRLAERYRPASHRHRLQHRLDDRAGGMCAPRSIVPIVGTVPAIKPAAAVERYAGSIGVLGTAGDGAPALCR